MSHPININKQGKPHVISKTSLRKILSLIILNCIYLKVDEYISAYRKNRRRSSRFYIATTQKYKDELNIMGIELSIVGIFPIFRLTTLQF